MLKPISIILSSLVLSTSQNSVSTPQQALQPQEYMYLSAVVNAAAPPYEAQIQCIRLPQQFTSYPTIGTSLPLLPHLDQSNVTLVRLPPNSSEPLHHPPHPMLFILLSGLAHVRLPAAPDAPGLWIVAGVNPIIVATDVLGLGHWTDYPGRTESLALQVPFGPGGGLGAVQVVHQGPCEMPAGWEGVVSEMLRGF